MDRLKKAALLTRLIEKLRENESWCGETHVQKATLFLQDLMRVRLGFDFIVYKHGPFSFDLRDELTSLRADGLLTLESHRPYGPRIKPTDHSRYIQGISSKTVESHNDKITFVAKKLGSKGVTELERLAMAFYLTEHAEPGASVNERADELVKLKPHISPGEALAAIGEVDKIVIEASKLL